MDVKYVAKKLAYWQTLSELLLFLLFWLAFSFKKVKFQKKDKTIEVQVGDGILKWGSGYHTSKEHEMPRNQGKKECTPFPIVGPNRNLRLLVRDSKQWTCSKMGHSSFCSQKHTVNSWISTAQKMRASNPGVCTWQPCGIPSCHKMNILNSAINAMDIVRITIRKRESWEVHGC
jgi:hypothetical protein